MNIDKNSRKKTLPIFPKASLVIPSGPMATKPYPIIASTILWVPETGRLKNVAISNHKLVQVRALKDIEYYKYSYTLKKFHLLTFQLSFIQRLQ